MIWQHCCTTYRSFVDPREREVKRIKAPRFLLCSPTPPPPPPRRQQLHHPCLYTRCRIFCIHDLDTVYIYLAYNIQCTYYCCTGCFRKNIVEILPSTHRSLGVGKYALSCGIDSPLRTPPPPLAAAPNGDGESQLRSLVLFPTPHNVSSIMNTTG